MIIDIIPIVTIVYIWNIVFDNILTTFKNVDISRNIRSLLTMIIFIVSYNLLGTQYYQHLSIFLFSSYLYDTYLILYHYRKNLKPQIVFILHHYICLISSYYIYIGQNKEFILEQYYNLDLSNIFLYVAAICNKLYPTHKKLNLYLLVLEYIFYVYYRIYKLTLIYFNYIDNIYSFNIHDKAILILIYTMGIVWSYKLTRILFKSLKK